MIKIIPKQRHLFVISLFLFFYNNLIFAQNGPAGVGNNKGTSGQPENIMWYQPDGFQVAGGFISGWTDQSGNARNIVQNTVGFRPELKVASGMNYAFFDGTDDRLPIDGSALANTPYTIFMVAGRRANGTGNGMLMGGTTGGSNQNLHPYFNTNTELRYHHWGNDYGATIAGFNSGVENFGIVTFRLNQTNRSMFQNGNYIGNGGDGSELTAFNDAHLGYRPNGSRAGQIDLREFIAYGTTLNDAQVLIVSNYLSEKYGLAMLSTDLYSGAAPGFNKDLAGVGTLNGNPGGQNGSHLLAGSAGFYIEQGTGGFASGEFLMVGHAGGGNNSITSNLSAPLTNRWERSWYLDKTGNISANALLSFSMQEGVLGGQFPGDLSNYRLLYRAANSGNFSQVAVQGTSLSGTDRITFEVTNANLLDGYYTLGTVNEALSPIKGLPTTTWYSYYSGDWDDYTTWTLDPSGTNFNNPGNQTPMGNAVHKVVILNGDEINITGNAIENASIDIQAGGLLNLGTTSGHSFGEINGAGIIRTSGTDNFPNFTDASNFQANGTLELIGTGCTMSNANSTGVFHNIRLNLTNQNSEFVMLRNLEISGDLTIKSGTFKINDNTSITRLDLTIQGNVIVENNGRIRVGSGNTLNNNIGGTGFPYQIELAANNNWSNGNTRRPNGIDYFNLYHRIGIFGDFINNGSVRFTNQDRPNYGAFAGQANLFGQSDAASVASGAATVSFRGNTNNNLICNGTTDFYQLIVNKGNNETYKLQLNASALENFNIYGPNRFGGVTTGTASMGPLGTYVTNGSGQVMNLKAICLLNGTLEIVGQTLILAMTGAGGSGQGTNSDYYIPSTARLWVNSPNAEVYTSIAATAGTPPTPLNFVSIADHIPSAYGGISSVRLPNTTIDAINFTSQNGGSALSIYGTLQVSQGILSTRNSAGFIYWANSAAKIQIDGGYVEGSILRNANIGGIASVVITGGKLTLRHNDTANNLPGEGSNTAIFAIGDPSNSFTMTGGTLEINDANGNGGILINSSISNTNVTGGNIVLKTRDNDRFRINSTAPFFNLTLANNTNSANANARFFLDSITSGSVDYAIRELKILNDLT